MANFTADQIRTDFGFAGALITTYDDVSRRAAVGMFNQMVDLLGGDPENARQFLNTRDGRVFVDELTFVVDPSASLAEIQQALAQAKTHKRLSFLWKRFASFEPYEDKPAQESRVPSELVNRLIG